MPKKPRKPLSPEQRDRKNARDRERYHLARDAGFSPDDARSIKKAIDKQPEILQAPSEALLKMMSNVNGLGDALIQFAKGLGDEPKKRGTSRAPRTIVKEKKTRRKPARVVSNEAAFSEFVKARPHLSANKILDEWRKQSGKPIGNVRGKEIIRQQRGTQKRENKITRFRHVSNDEKGWIQNLTKDRYMYLVRYEVETLEEEEPFDQYAYVTSDTPLTLREIKKLAAEQFDRAKDENIEKYTVQQMVPGSIVLIKAIDTTL